MGGSAHLAFTMGALMAGGGLAGYVKAKSVPSLAGGVGSAALFIAAGMLIHRGDDLQGHQLALGTSALLATGMGFRAVSSGKFMPAGMIAALGAASAAYRKFSLFLPISTFTPTV